VRGLLTQADIARILQVREALGLHLPDAGRSGGATGRRDRAGDDPAVTSQ
jgi:hypothetical protein